jgi:calcium-dependent protein kinase
VLQVNRAIEKDFSIHKNSILGKGGCGIVIKGQNRKTKLLYAIKILDKSMAAKSIEKSRMMREYKILTEIEHTNVIRLFKIYDDVNDRKKYIYFVMELCTGGHLGELIAKQKRGCLDEKWAKKLARQLLSAVTHIHSIGICHRDIKLQNILISIDTTPPTIEARRTLTTSQRKNTTPNSTENNNNIANYENTQIKLIDFGYASKFSSSTLPMTTKCGTPYTTAPEVLKECYDQRCDVWSVGVVLFVMLCGRRPFEVLKKKKKTDNHENNRVNARLDRHEEKKQILMNILHCNYNFDHKAWNNVTYKGKKFVQRLLEPDYLNRMFAHEALQNVWLKNSNYWATKMLKSSTASTALHNMASNSDVNNINNNDLKKTGMFSLVFGFKTNHQTNNELVKLFQSFDFDASGTLSREEYHSAMQIILSNKQPPPPPPPQQQQQQQQQLTKEKIDEMFDAIDVDHNQSISFTEFLVASLDPTLIDFDELENAFDLLDSDCSGFISKNELYKVFFFIFIL